MPNLPTSVTSHGCDRYDDFVRSTQYRHNMKNLDVTLAAEKRLTQATEALWHGSTSSAPLKLGIAAQESCFCSLISEICFRVFFNLSGSAE